jgi:phospholipase C
MPIDHVVVLMQENRSFDTYLGPLHNEGQPMAEGPPAGALNPNPTGANQPPITPFHKTTYCETAGDLEHSWTGTHREIDGGRMDGFTAANANAQDPTGSRTMGYYDRADLPFYYGLYNTFATGDRYFSSVPGPTFPNRFYLLAGTSFGHIENDLPPPDGFSQKTVFELLDQAHVSWKIYFSEVPFAAEFSYVRNHALGHVEPITSYYLDAAAGRLPQVSFVDPILVGVPAVENDEHPPSNVQLGQSFVAGVVGALERSPNWLSSALFLTYDEHGGYYDHVAPPAAPVPDAIPPMLQPGDTPAAFDSYGVRVPVAVVSPWAKPHSVSHVVHDHTSILRFIETRFGLPSLTARDAAADPMLEFFDFSHPSLRRPPALPPASVDLGQEVACALVLPSLGL